MPAPADPTLLAPAAARSGSGRLFGSPWVAAGLAAAFALACASGIPGLGDTDPYRHLATAAEVWRTRFSLRGLPFLPFTTLGDSGVDLWWGFHRLLVPFAALGTLWGARLAGACIAASVAGFSAWLLRRAGQPRAALFAVAPLAISFSFAYRAQLARPAHLTIPLVLCALAAGAGELPARWAFAGGLSHALLHLSSPLSPLFALVGLGGARLGGGRGQPRSVLWSVGGLALGLLLRPDRALYLPIAVLHNAGALHLSSGAPHGVGVELLPLPLRDLAFETWAGFALLGLAALLGGRLVGQAGRPLRTAVLLALALATALTLRTARFLDYVPPLAALAAGLFWPAGWPERGHAPGPVGATAGRMAGLVAAAGLVALGARNLGLAWEQGSWTGTPEVYEALRDAVRARVPPGSILFTDDVFRTAAIYASLPEYRYLVMADPSLLLTASPIEYFRWLHAVRDATYCEAPDCPGKRGSPAQVARAIDAFGSAWAITTVPRRASPLVEAMLSAPALFEPVFAGQGGEAGFVLWQVKRLAP